MSPHNKYDFYQPNKKISSIDIKDALSYYIINKNINSDFKVQHISSIDNFYSNSAIFINSDKEFYLNEDEILIITNNKNFLKKYKNCVLVNDINKSFKALANHIYVHDDTLNYKYGQPML